MKTAIIVVAHEAKGLEEYRRFGVYMCPDPTWNNGVYRKSRFWDSECTHFAFYSQGRIRKEVPFIQYRVENVLLSEKGIRRLRQKDVRKQDLSQVKDHLNRLVQQVRASGFQYSTTRLGEPSQVLFLSPPDDPQTIHLGQDIDNDKLDHSGKLTAFIQKFTYVALTRLRTARRTSDLASDMSHKVGDESDGRFRVELAAEAAGALDDGDFSPETLQDERQRQLRAIVQRRGQPDFRRKLIRAYGGRCALTRCDALAALEAVHIVPYCGPESNHVTNGRLLRADIHTLFDLDLIRIEPVNMTVVLGPALEGTMYGKLAGKSITLPAKPSDYPNHQALAERWEKFSAT
jgi:hypothetical protein